MNIQEVYEKYKHLDDFMLDERWLDDSFKQLAADLWQAIKNEVESHDSRSAFYEEVEKG